MAYAFPLTLIPFLLFNIIGYSTNIDWNAELFSIPMVQAPWRVSVGDLLVLLGLVMLFFETLKAARPAPRAIANHLASTAVFIVYLLEFVLLGVAANSTFFLLMVISLFDVVAGFTISIRTASRDVQFTREGV